MPICWMCSENKQLTGEHIFKHSILRALYGSSPLKKGNQLIVWEEKEYNGRVIKSKKYINSMDSEKFKFKKSLCSQCNGGKSKPWDDELDIFIFNLFENWQLYLKNGNINLSDFCSKNSPQSSRNLYNYFCKLFGCRLFTLGQPVPKEIIDAVNGRDYENSFGISIVFDVDLEHITDLRDHLKNGDVVGDPSDELNYRWELVFGPIKISFFYRTPAEYSIGERWFGKTERIPFVKNI